MISFPVVCPTCSRNTHKTIFTCWTKRYPATRCDPTVRTTLPGLRSLWDSISDCSRTISALTRRLSSSLDFWDSKRQNQKRKKLCDTCSAWSLHILCYCESPKSVCIVVRLTRLVISERVQFPRPENEVYRASFWVQIKSFRRKCDESIAGVDRCS